jgi:hypothetical protein
LISLSEHRVRRERDRGRLERVSETPNCKFDPNTTIGSDQPGYKQCIQSAIEGALGVLFNREEMVGIDTLILPALGTNTGKVFKGDFYQSAAKSLHACLQLPGCAEKLPRTIVLAVWSSERAPNTWGETRDAIARNITALGENWMPHYVPNLPPFRRSAHLATLLCLGVLPSGYTPRIEKVLDGLAEMRDASEKTARKQFPPPAPRASSVFSLPAQPRGGGTGKTRPAIGDTVPEITAEHLLQALSSDGVDFWSVHAERT